MRREITTRTGAVPGGRKLYTNEFGDLMVYYREGEILQILAHSKGSSILC